MNIGFELPSDLIVRPCIVVVVFWIVSGTMGALLTGAVNVIPSVLSSSSSTWSPSVGFAMDPLGLVRGSDDVFSATVSPVCSR